MTTAQTTFINARIEQAKAEILDTVGKGFYPEGKILTLDLKSYSELHDHCDANELGGLCDDDIVQAGDALFGTSQEMRDAGDISDGWIDACNTIQNAIDAWIKSGQIHSDFLAAK